MESTADDDQPYSAFFSLERPSRFSGQHLSTIPVVRRPSAFLPGSRAWKIEPEGTAGWSSTTACFLAVVCTLFFAPRHSLCHEPSCSAVRMAASEPDRGRRPLHACGIGRNESSATTLSENRSDTPGPRM